MHKAFQPHRRPVRVLAQRCASADKGPSDKTVAGTAMKTLTAVLAAGAVLLPHASLAVSGGGGQLRCGSFVDLNSALVHRLTCKYLCRTWNASQL